jgi:DNA modification methylase
MNYNELMSWYNEHYKDLYGFEPKSFWEYIKNNFFDKQIEDEIATKTLKEEFKQKKENPNYHKDFGARTSFSKFNSEYARRLIEFYTCKGDKILDPFSGRTRKKICEILGRNYTGFEINKEYCQDNVINDDCINSPKYLKDKDFDCLFTCPPYWNLEVYSENLKGDLSICKTYEEFVQEYFKRMSTNLQFIKNSGLIIIVIADYREKNRLLPLHYNTIKILENNQWQL